MIMSTDNRPRTITEKTAVPLGLVVLLIIQVVGGTWWMSGRLNSVDNNVAALAYKFDSNQTLLSEKIDAARLADAQNMKKKDMEIWRLQLQVQNKTLSVPSLPQQ
jgi:hypothetical protein